MLLPDGRVIRREEPMQKGQAERLVPMLEELLAAAGMVWKDLRRIAVGTGPGNFTGVRISVATARGLSLALGIPAIAVTRLEALAHGLPRPLSVIEDARQGAVYLQRFSSGGESPALLLPAGSGRPSGAATGNAAGPEALPPAMPLAEAIARIAATRPPARRLRPST
ncbi:hypothetical protein MASR1M32_40250 [Rhodobacter sp.]